MPEAISSVFTSVGFFYVIGLIAFLLSWESGAPRVEFPDRRQQWRHVVANFSLLAIVVFIYSYQPFLLIAQSMPFGQTLLVGWAHPWFDRLPLSWLWQLVAGLAILDCADYFLHKTFHGVPFLWRFHRVHHADPHLDVSTGARAHPLEALLATGSFLVVLSLVGLPLWIEAMRLVLVNPVSVLQHANVNFPPWLDSFFSPLFVTPEIHRIHHSRSEADFDRNFGQLFSFWDRLFGTYRSPKTGSATSMGLDGCDDLRWNSIFGMLATPFRKL
jgi:sterol desaturase/sphingolipid hydroxylase (fatty acid hydroxylase superfamily)